MGGVYLQSDKTEGVMNKYESPVTEMWNMEYEGIICESGNEDVEENEGIW